MRLSVAVGSVLHIFAAASGYAQPPSLAVVSIRPNLSGSTSSSMGDPKNGRFTATNVTPFSLICNAYRILEFQVRGGPRWIRTDRYDIQAKLSSADKVEPAEFEAALQRLLADRFKMAAHWETIQQPVYVLIAEKSGSKLRQNSGSEGPVLNGGGGTERRSLNATGVSMPLLAFFLSRQMDRMVIDKTELNGDYDFKLEWSTDQMADSSAPALSTALKELGLRLEARRGPVKVLVIDEVSKASEN
jgi:uncharacterized protein (TIGR03435 family)